MRSKLNIIIPIGIALIAIALAFVFIRFAPTKTTDIGAMISTAQQYLTEQKYEQAIAEFQKIIEIDPKNADAYIGMAKAYIGIGDTDKAVEVLEDGYEQTNDDRILEMLEELKSGEETAETTVTTVETTETTTEVTETETTKDAEIERVRQQALDILSPYAPNKSKGEPNSTFYAYVNGIWGYNCFKCEYDENGDLKKEYFTSIREGVLNGNITTINSNGTIYNMFKKLDNGNFNVFEGNGSYYEGWGDEYSLIEKLSILKESENEYKVNNNNITIFIDNDMVTKIEGFSGSLTYNYELSAWENDNNSSPSPYIIGLPDGYDDSIFELDESKIEKTFTDYNEYHDYINNN